MKRILEINLILAVWLILAPSVLAYATGHVAARSDDIVIGVLLVAGSLWILTAAPTTQLGVTAFEGACGIWLILAPFALHERAISHALANDVTVGALVLLVSLADAWMVTGRRPHRTA